MSNIILLFTLTIVLILIIIVFNMAFKEEHEKIEKKRKIKERVCYISDNGISAYKIRAGGKKYCFGSKKEITKDKFWEYVENNKYIDVYKLSSFWSETEEPEEKVSIKCKKITSFERILIGDNDNGEDCIDGGMWLYSTIDIR